MKISRKLRVKIKGQLMELKSMAFGLVGFQKFGF